MFFFCYNRKISDEIKEFATNKRISTTEKVSVYKHATYICVLHLLIVEAGLCKEIEYVRLLTTKHNTNVLKYVLHLSQSTMKDLQIMLKKMPQYQQELSKVSDSCYTFNHHHHCHHHHQHSTVTKILI